MNTPISSDTTDAYIFPEGRMEVLSKQEVDKLMKAGNGSGGMHEIFRKCALAVLNTGVPIDDSKVLFEMFSDFEIKLIPQERGIQLQVRNAPASAFVDGKMIKGLREHLFSVLRDIVYSKSQIERKGIFDLTSSGDLTNAVFHILRNAGTLKPGDETGLAVCWGGHAITRREYDYTKKVGYELGLRGLNICTGCGHGAMKGPMKGATIAHAKQRIITGSYIGLTEPGIIATEPPNPIVNKLVLLPDIEKRLEAFVRLGHVIIIFPGGVGTSEELLYLLGILMHPENRDVPFPLIISGPEESRDFLKRLDNFVGTALGPEAQSMYTMIIGDPTQTAHAVMQGVEEVINFRKETDDAYYYNWHLKIDYRFQVPFEATHENMAQLDLHHDQPVHELAANLRRAFSGIVAGNVREDGIRAIEKKGPFEISCDPSVLTPLDKLLDSFVKEGRMKLPGSVYEPCYRIVG